MIEWNSLKWKERDDISHNVKVYWLLRSFKPIRQSDIQHLLLIMILNVLCSILFLRFECHLQLIVLWYTFAFHRVTVCWDFAIVSDSTARSMITKYRNKHWNNNKHALWKYNWNDEKYPVHVIYCLFGEKIEMLSNIYIHSNKMVENYHSSHQFGEMQLS